MEYFIQENFQLGTIDIWAFEKTEYGRRITFQDGKGTLTTQHLKHGEAISDQVFPLLRISTFEWQNFVDSVAKKTPATKGLFVDGKLAGVEKHLEDMQTIVKKLLKI